MIKQVQPICFLKKSGVKEEKKRKGRLNSHPLLMLTPKHTSNTGRIALQM
jgi:hypothetical protein